VTGGFFTGFTRHRELSASTAFNTAPKFTVSSDIPRRQQDRYKLKQLAPPPQMDLFG
jgi:hypothetical protein